jgi:TetR/AcrR family transcriptional regulator, cholesterol catabolism regulator
MEDLILQTAYKLFTGQGIQPFTMDDIASRLAISKKTLYRFFESRAHLVQQVCKQLLENYERDIAAIDRQASTLKQMMGFMAVNIDFCKRTSPAFFTDLQKHYPVESNNVMGVLNNYLLSIVLPLMEQGIVEGVFRGNLHPQLVVSIMQQHIKKDFEFAAELVNDYSKDEVFRQAMYLFLYGIIAPNAIAQLETELITYSNPATIESV